MGSLLLHLYKMLVAAPSQTSPKGKIISTLDCIFCSFNLKCILINSQLWVDVIFVFLFHRGIATANDAVGIVHTSSKNREFDLSRSIQCGSHVNQEGIHQNYLHEDVPQQ